ncbi:unnamed protein product [Bursaphelenchus okinawaensis]|uniref:Uncharacterized protein n=1 Tax=Bursaphelenchus okinawaensis TaxID=465554 RepID=A0A811LRV3_9BILA|nr:unnamed protein product [Bursaphelenchus okinawaensis]CAG9128490.1 unnamed protein product [Bursaphelenchus okinawaensis]
MCSPELCRTLNILHYFVVSWIVLGIIIPTAMLYKKHLDPIVYPPLVMTISALIYMAYCILCTKPVKRNQPEMRYVYLDTRDRDINGGQFNHQLIPLHVDTQV